MTRRGLQSQLTVVVLCTVALIAALAAHEILPEQFLRDDEHLQLSMRPEKAYLTAASFQAVGHFYTVIGLAGAPELASLLGVAVFVVCVFLAIGWDRLRDANMAELAFIAVALLIAVVYLGQYSKEIVTLGLVLLTLALPRGRGWDLVLVGAAAAYGVTLRPYWLLVAPLYLLWRFALHRVRRTGWLLLLPVLFYAAAQPAFQLVLGAGMQSQREEVNTVRDGLGDVATLIESPLPDGPGLQGIIAILLMLVLFLVPVPLLASMSPYHMASGLVIVALWVLVITQVARGHLTGSGAARTDRPHTAAARSASLLLALVMVQTFFEPDYGSYLKHLTPLLPLAMALLPAALGRRKEPTAVAADPTISLRGGVSA